MTLGPDDKTPAPNDEYSPAEVNSVLRKILARVKALEDHRIVDAINEHEDRLDSHDERHDTSDQRHDASDQRHVATEAKLKSEQAATALWREAFDKKTDGIVDGVGRIEKALGTAP